MQVFSPQGAALAGGPAANLKGLARVAAVRLIKQKPPLIILIWCSFESCIN